MPCYYPMKFYRDPSGPKSNGKWPLVSTEPKGGGIPVTVPCQRCIGCRLERSRQWAVRIMNEAQMHENNCFITLTYNDDNLPKGISGNQTLKKRDLTLFWKSLRKELAKNGTYIRYFACGEYGDTTNRPHYHAALFGYDFPDKKYFSTSMGNYLYTSDLLTNIWGLGHCVIGNLTFESAAYVARYIVGKKLGREADYYNELEITPEYCVMSRGKEFKGIGYSWFQKYQNDVIQYDIQVVNGKSTKPPKYYDKLLNKINENQYNKNKNERLKHKFKNRKENKIERLKSKEFILNQKAGRLKRKLD